MIEENLRIAIVGSRTGFNQDFVWRVLKSLKSYYGQFIIVSGGARGVDLYAESFAKANSIQSIVYQANWAKDGKSAGFLRNLEIVKNSDAMIAFWDGQSKGTLHDINIQKKANKPLEIIYPTSKSISREFLDKIKSTIIF